MKAGIVQDSDGLPERLSAGKCNESEKDMEKNAKEQYFVWIFKGMRIFLRGSEIWYVSSEQGRTLLHTRNQVYQVSGPMREEARKLQELPMVRIHNSFLVNMDKLEVISAKGAMLKNHEQIPVSRGCWGSARLIIDDYYSRKCGTIPKIRGNLYYQ